MPKIWQKKPHQRMGFMAYLIKLKFGSEVNSERTECHVIGHLGRLMSAVLLLG